MIQRRAPLHGDRTDRMPAMTGSHGHVVSTRPGGTLADDARHNPPRHRTEKISEIVREMAVRGFLQRDKLECEKCRSSNEADLR